MKKIVCALAFAAASLLSTTASAQAYVSGALGLSHFTDCASCDNNDVALKVLGGYQFAGGFAAELGYITFGKATDNDGSGDNVKTGGFLIGGAYHHQINKSWGLTGRVGAAVLKTRITGFNSDTSTKPYIGFGGTYALNPNLKLEAAVDFARAEHEGDSGDVRAITAGVRFQF